MGKVTRHRVVWQIHQGPNKCKLFSISCERSTPPIIMEIGNGFPLRLFMGGRVSFSQKVSLKIHLIFLEEGFGIGEISRNKNSQLAWNFSPSWHKSRWNFEPKNWLDPPIGSNPTTKKALGKKHKKNNMPQTHWLQPWIYMESLYHQGTHSTPTDHRFASALWRNGANESWKVIVVSIWPFLISEIPAW